MSLATLVSASVLLPVLVSAPDHRQQSSDRAAVDETIVCRSLALEPQRTWTFTARAGTWRVVHQINGQTARATLALPQTAATLTADTVSVRSRTANGGIDLTLRGPWAAATLDAYVNYELEVNVDASLTPEIDAIATEGPTGVGCTREP